MVSPAFANAAWIVAGAPAWMAFTRALEDPAREQEKVFGRYVKTGSQTAFGREHGLYPGMNYEQFARRVPVRDYDQLAPWIERIRRGEGQVLTSDRVRRLIPTSGSTAARKLIPYTNESHREFQRAVAPWIVDLYRQRPRAIAGPSYWSVTPIGNTSAPNSEHSAVPIGFESDSEYLGGWHQMLVGAAMAVPNAVNRIDSIDALRYVTLLLLLRRRDLALISVWHPSFLELLLREIRERFDELVGDVAGGSCTVTEHVPAALRSMLQSRPNARRAKELELAGPADVISLWPRLSVVSCWADGPARAAAAQLGAALPGIAIQPKGLLASEGVISIPFAGNHPLAIRSHFFEFLDAAGRATLASDLRAGETYSVVLTTGGGLWRYRLGDVVRVTGRCGATPTISFLGKSGLVSDLRGEKLSEGFVADVLARLFAGHPPQPAFALLAPACDAAGLCYTLYVDSPPATPLHESLDELLSANPQYAYCRRLGQLLPPRIVVAGRDAYAAYCRRLTAEGQRLGDIKPACLSTRDGWSTVFAGRSER